MLPIYVMYETELSVFERYCVDKAMQEFKNMFPEREIVIFGFNQWCEGDYSCADWYIEKARVKQSTCQIDASGLLDLMQNEPWQWNNPHVDVLFTSKDLFASGLNYCFGMTRGRCTVQSVYRYRYLNTDDRELAIKTVAWHELGHVFGMAGNLRRGNTEYKLGAHCTNYGCVMRQGMNVDEWVRHAKEAKRMGRIYCPQCMLDMRLSKI